MHNDVTKYAREMSFAVSTVVRSVGMDWFNIFSRQVHHESRTEHYTVFIPVFIPSEIKQHQRKIAKKKLYQETIYQR